MFFTVSNVQAPFLQLEGLINGINDEKSMVMQLIRHLEISILARTWGPGLYLFSIGWIVQDEYMTVECL